MKKLIYAILLLCLMGCERSENNGGMDSSGGNVSRSTLRQTRENIGLSWMRLGHYLQGQHMLISDIEANRERKNSYQAHLMRMFSKMKNEPKLEMKTIKILITDDNCYEGGEIRDGSYSQGAICMSASRLALLPWDVLGREVTALLLHELTHHYGFDENFAKDLQSTFRQIYGSDFGLSTFIEAKWAAYFLKQYLKEFEFKKQGIAPQNDICQLAGMVPSALNRVMESDYVSERHLFGYPYASPSFIKTVEEGLALNLPCTYDELSDENLMVLGSYQQKLEKVYASYLEQTRRYDWEYLGTEKIFAEVENAQY